MIYKVHNVHNILDTAKNTQVIPMAFTIFSRKYTTKI